MVPYYRLVTSSGALVPDTALLDEMDKANEEELKRLDERLAEAEKTEGESEISDALKARANHLTRIGDKVCRWPAQRAAQLTPLAGACRRSAGTCTAENPWTWIKDRYIPHSYPDWTFFR